MSCCTKENQTVVHRILRNPTGIFNTFDKALQFGLPLQDICLDNKLPPRLRELLEVLYVHGSESVHVFGVRPLVSDCVELKSKLECGDTIQWHAYSIYVHAAVFLNFLQCLPTPLLGHDFYDDWMDVATSKNTLETKAKLMRTSRRLPQCHQELLRQWLLVLRKVCRAVPRSHTTPALAGHFVGPSMLWRPGASFVEHPASGEHAALATVVRCFVLFLDDVWNDVDEKAIFARKRSTRESVVEAMPDAFATCTASQYVDSLERESRRQAELHNMIVADSSPKPPQVGALRRCSRSVHTWPGRVRRSPASPPAPSGAVSKVATFPRRSHLDDGETGLPPLHDEDYLYPDWAFRYPEWQLCGEELPAWASRSCFTMDLNSLHDQTTALPPTGPSSAPSAWPRCPGTRGCWCGSSAWGPCHDPWASSPTETGASPGSVASPWTKATSLARTRLAGVSCCAEQVGTWCSLAGVKESIIYVFSVDNFQRPRSEQDGLFREVSRRCQYILDNSDNFRKMGRRVRCVGDLEMLPKDLQRSLAKVDLATADNARTLTVACVAYSSRRQVTRMARRLAQAVKEGQLRSEETSALEVLAPSDSFAVVLAPNSRPRRALAPRDDPAMGAGADLRLGCSSRATRSWRRG
ncbi:uncharacterized protein [Dermacentor albipictus]|uniref:uncharacterized protein isoform X2 n=1 Tax=Dermacentor albipictus TaxID=60249 RepID=UPI0038FCE3D9